MFSTMRRQERRPRIGTIEIAELESRPRYARRTFEFLLALDGVMERLTLALRAPGCLGLLFWRGSS
jgi:hypothetical protein